jgi:hypothetical protein
MLVEPQESSQELTPLNIIRSETVLSRYPIHRLAKRGNISIEINRQNEEGEVTFKWEVSYNSRYGQPGPLAYKLDTLVINRRIDEAGKPLPKIICLGSLRDICEELGIFESGQNTSHLKRALRQNAFAAVTAKIRYKGLDGAERSVEINDTRYGIIFTGERLPNGSKADAVYLTLHDFYREILNNTSARPLNYDYLRELPPAPQRFYELISYQIYAALKHKRPRARYIYSDYCTYAPQTRYLDYEHVKKQMYKIHALHRQSGYLAKIEFQPTTDRDGQPDWIMFYTPGRKAKAEHEAFTRKNYPAELDTRGKTKALLPSEALSSRTEPELHLLSNLTAAIDSKPKSESFVTKLKGLGVSDKKARELVLTKGEVVEQQLSALSYRMLGENQKNPAGWIVAAIENNYELPKQYIEILAKAGHDKEAKKRRATLDACSLCDSSGFRHLGGRLGVKKCTHDPEIEAKYPSTQ